MYSTDQTSSHGEGPATDARHVDMYSFLTRVLVRIKSRVAQRENQSHKKGSVCTKAK